MQTKTFIPGKDAPLEETVTKVHALLEKLEVQLEEVSHLNPVPHCWSVHIRDKKIPTLYTNGKGTSKLSSLASGTGEFMERLATDFFFSEFYIGTHHELNGKPSFTFFPDERWFRICSTSGKIADCCHEKTGSRVLNPELHDFYDPESELTPLNLVDNNCDINNQGICALPFINITDSSECYFPISLLNNLYVSNGMAAGNSSSECKSQALSEIIERYVKNIVISKGLSLPHIPEQDLAQFPHLVTIRDNLSDSGFSITIHDSSLGGQFPVICVLLVDQKSGGAYAAFGANCRFETAIERTLTELLQGRDLKQLHSFNRPATHLDTVADHYNLESHFIDSDGLLCWRMFKDEPDYQYNRWSFNGDTEAEEAELVGRILASGHSIYLREYLHLGLYTCRFIVPGMSEIYPVDDLIWNNRNKGAFLRKEILKLPSMNHEQLHKTMELLEEVELDDTCLLSHAIGVLFDAKSNWDTLRIGELKALISLALKDYQSAIKWCDWVVDFGGLKGQRHNIFRAVSTLLQLNEVSVSKGNYEKSLPRFFSKSDFNAAEDILSQKSVFFGLNFETTWETISKGHCQLLALYKKLREMKASYYNTEQR